jgi:hypothetical protein
LLGAWDCGAGRWERGAWEEDYSSARTAVLGPGTLGAWEELDWSLEDDAVGGRPVGRLGAKLGLLPCWDLGLGSGTTIQGVELGLAVGCAAALLGCLAASAQPA